MSSKKIDVVLTDEQTEWLEEKNLLLNHAYNYIFDYRERVKTVYPDITVMQLTAWGLQLREENECLFDIPTKMYDLMLYDLHCELRNLVSIKPGVAFSHRIPHHVHRMLFDQFELKDDYVVLEHVGPIKIGSYEEGDYNSVSLTKNWGGKGKQWQCWLNRKNRVDSFSHTLFLAREHCRGGDVGLTFANNRYIGDIPGPGGRK